MSIEIPARLVVQWYTGGPLGILLGYSFVGAFLTHTYHDPGLTGSFARVYLVRRCMASFSMPLIARASATVS